MPSPPPRLSSGSSTPSSSRTWTSSPSTRWAATSKPPVSKICEPMWECRPTRSRPGAASTRRTASRASPPASEKPNFWSSCAVAMNSWVCASTPTVVRTSTGWVVPRSVHRRDSRSISASESTTIRPTPASSAAASSASDLLLPCRSIRSPGKPARTATASSPPVHTSRPSPSSLDPAGHRGAEERLGGVEDHRAAERLPVVAAAPAQVGLVQQEDRAAVLGHQVGDVVAAQGQAPAAVPGEAERPDGRVQRAQVVGGTAVQALVGELAGPRPGGVGTHRRTAYIRSGALTPSSRSPLASTTRVASTSQSRARWVSVGSSSPRGSTRQAS